MHLSESNPDFEALLDYLKRSRGCDLTDYKRSTLMRRFHHRMQNIRIDTYQGYLQYLQDNSEEYLALLDDVLINVTSFFRDSEVWDYLASEIIPKIIASKQADEPIRVWSAGCAAGQEIYSLLILLSEALGIESCLARVQCFATDVDEAALRQARQGIYSHSEIMDISADWLEKYFQQTEQGYVFCPMLRRTIVFGRHNLSKDAPISKLDLLICRNVLIYFNSDAQTSILTRFHFALKNTGFLLLGKAESLVNPRQIFIPVHTKHRVYAKGLDLELENYLSITPKFRTKQVTDSSPIQNYFWQTAFESSPVAQFAIDLNGCLIGANQEARLLFGLSADDWNQCFEDLEPGRLISTHTSAITNRNRHLIMLKNIEWNTSQGTHYFDVTIAPVLNSKKQLLGNTLTFVEKTDCIQLKEELKYANSELEKISEALQATRAELESANQKIRLLEQDAPYKN